MTKKALLLLLLAGMACGCAPRPVLRPRDGTGFRSLSIKFSFRDDRVRQNGRISWRFDADASKFLFFTPLNQLGLELNVCGEEAVLANHGQKTFWSGDFSSLIERMWGLALSHADLKSLLAGNGTTPAGFAGNGIAVELEHAAGDGALETVRLRRGAAQLSLRILKDEFRKGRIVRVDYTERYQPLDLESVLADD